MFWIAACGSALVIVMWTLLKLQDPIARLMEWSYQRWRRYRDRDKFVEWHGIDPPVCAKCGYDLRSSPDYCPECGTKVAPLDGTIVRYMMKLRKWQ